MSILSSQDEKRLIKKEEFYYELISLQDSAIEYMTSQGGALDRVLDLLNIIDSVIEDQYPLIKNKELIEEKEDSVYSF